MPKTGKARGKPFVEGNQSWAGNPDDEPGAGALTSACPLSHTGRHAHAHKHAHAHSAAHSGAHWHTHEPHMLQ